MLAKELGRVPLNSDVMQIARPTSCNKHYAAFGLLFQINCAATKQVFGFRQLC